MSRLPKIERERKEAHLNMPGEDAGTPRSHSISVHVSLRARVQSPRLGRQEMLDMHLRQLSNAVSRGFKACIRRA